MSTARVLVVYGTSHGQTAKIAGRVRDLLTARGFDVTLAKGDTLPAGFSLAGYQGAVIGASIIIGGHQRYIRRFVLAHRDELAGLTSAFFSVSGSAGSPFPEERLTARRLMAEFLTKTGWQPRLAQTFAGAITYTKYNPLLRWVMKRISRKEGGSTDTSRDHEYTNWDDVARFTDAFAEAVAEARADPVVPTSTLT
jgi:menaquinone-dependent protoporphyrinogen oxidase